MTLHAFYMEDDQQGIEHAIAKLSAADALRLRAMTAPSRRREFVLSRWLVAFALMRTLGGRGWSLLGQRGHRPIGCDASGRRHRAVNISHSRGGLLCTVAEESALQLGCDLEAVRERSASSWRHISALERVHPVFSVLDRQWLLAGEASERHERLCALWTLKEAIGKATGMGILHGGLRELQPDWRAMTRLLAQAAAPPSLPIESDSVARVATAWSPVAVSGPWHVQLARLSRHWLAVAVPQPSLLELHVVLRGDLLASGA